MRILLFTSPFCHACKALKAILGDMEYEQINVIEHPELASRYLVMGLPTTIILKDDKVAASITGTYQKKDLEEIIRKFK